MFNFVKSVNQLKKRINIDQAESGRKRRSDQGHMRMNRNVEVYLRNLLLGHERPSMKSILQKLSEYCTRHYIKCPSRATVYKFMARTQGHEYEISSLPEYVQAALYNLSPDSRVPGHQLAFYCFNYGNLQALSFASGLPWLDLYQAARMRGFRPASRGLLDAVMRTRKI